MHIVQGLTLTAQLYCGIVILAGVFGNVLVLIVFLARWNRLKTYETFILMLAAVDLIQTILAPTFYVLESSKVDFKPIGTPGCKLFYFISSLGIHVSSYTLVMVSLDRYIAVKSPMKDRTNICRGMIVVMWILGLVFNMEWLVGDGMVLYKIHRRNSTSSGLHQKQRWICRLHDKKELEYLMYNMAFLQTLVPLIIMAITYSLIFCKLNNNSEETSQYKTEEDITIERKKTRKTSKLLVVIIAVFFLCITPKTVGYMYYHYNHAKFAKGILDSELFVNINILLTMLKLSNSCLNPLIYGKLHESFQNRLKLFFASRGNVRALIRQETCATSKFYTTRCPSPIGDLPLTPQSAVKVVSLNVSSLAIVGGFNQKEKIPTSPISSSIPTSPSYQNIVPS